MNFIQQKLLNFQSRYNVKANLVIFVSLTILLLSFFDSIISYSVPIVMTDAGLSEVQMGWMYASSSIFGLIFDFVLARYLNTTRYTRTFSYALAIALFFPLCIFVNPTPILFLLGMMFWALYYNFWAFASADFTARESKVAFHVASVSLLLFVHDIGYLAGTLSAEPLLRSFSYANLVYGLEGVILLAIILFFPLFRRKFITLQVTNGGAIRGEVSLKKEANLLRNVIVRLLPLLLFGVIISAVDATIWTVTPILDRVFPAIGGFGGVILAINFLPSFFAYAIADSITKRLGKKRTGMIAFILGALVLALLGTVSSVVLYMVITFCSAFFFSISYAAIGGAYADYLKESQYLDNEIVSTHDMSTNLGYIIGPIMGGTLLALVDSTVLFTYLGLAVAIIGLVLYQFTPRTISFRKT